MHEEGEVEWVKTGPSNEIFKTLFQNILKFYKSIFLIIIRDVPFTQAPKSPYSYINYTFNLMFEQFEIFE